MTMPQPLGVHTSPWRCPRAKTPRPLPPCGPLTQMSEPMGSCSTASWVRTYPHQLTQPLHAHFYSLLAYVRLGIFLSFFYIFLLFFHVYIYVSECVLLCFSSF